MNIKTVEAFPLNLEVIAEASGVKKVTNLSCVVVRIETENGLVGCGFTAITEEEIVASAINDVAAHHIIGQSVLNNERIWDKLYWLLTPRGQSGYGSHAIAAIDVAVWDLKAQALNLPLWRLLGGAREQVPVYATFGFGFLDKEQLAEAAKSWIQRGFKRLKMTVGNHALQRRDEPQPLADVIREDEARIRAVRAAIGNEPELCIDGNCGLDPYHARILADRIKDCNIAFFEEPITQNDARALADLRARISIPLAAGQNEGLASRFAEFCELRSLDIIQPNVTITGGYTQCQRIAGLAQAWNITMANGGAWPFHNMHLHAGLANGGFIEYHWVSVLVCEQIFDNLPVPEAGWLKLPTTPGLGFNPKWDVIRELAKRPLSKGSGKA